MSGIVRLDDFQNWETDRNRSQLLCEMGRVRTNASITVWSCSKMSLMIKSGTVKPMQIPATSSGGKSVIPSFRSMKNSSSSRSQK